MHPVYVATSVFWYNISLLYHVPKLYGSVLKGFPFEEGPENRNLNVILFFNRFVNAFKVRMAVTVYSVPVIPYSLFKSSRISAAQNFSLVIT